MCSGGKGGGEGRREMAGGLVLPSLGVIMRKFVSVVEVVSWCIQSVTACLRIMLNLNLPHIF